jgi:SAM-dependent methyltransferase
MVKNPSKEHLAAFNNGIRDFLNHIKNNKEQLKEGLRDIELPLPISKISDFGCGFGFTTYCPTSILNITESIGVDLDPLLIDQANKWFKAIKLHIQFESEKILPDNIVYQRANMLLEVLQPPAFIVGDVISGENLPSGIALAYCRKLLGNYKDNLSGIDQARLAINNIAKNIVHGGWLVAVEESSGGNFSQLLDQQGLTQVSITQSSPNKIVPLYTRYVYRKQN